MTISVSFASSKPAVAANVQAGLVSNYPDTSGGEPGGLTIGPDGALWFPNGTDTISRMTTSGVITNNYTSPRIGGASWLTAGPDGALWFTNYTGNSIGRITTSGVVTNTYTDPSISSPNSIAVGSDGALWFTNWSNDSIGRITTSGVVSNFPAPRPGGGNPTHPNIIVAGPDGALWFTYHYFDEIGRITTAGVLTNYPGTGVSYPGGIAVGSDSALWFTNPGNSSIGRITTSGLVSNYTDPGITGPNEIAAGPDGALWFTNYYSGNSIGRITTSGKVTNVYTDPTINLPNGITAGPDGAMWFYNSGTNSIGRITTTTNSHQPLRINPYSESVASPGVPYHLQFSASGGRSPLHWSISKGVLPEGLTLDRMTGEISGRPTTSALIGVTVKVTDSSKPVSQTATVQVLVSVDYQFEVFAVPIKTVVRQAVSGVVAHMSYRLNGLPPIAASRLRSTIRWGDGTSSAGIVKLVGPPMAGYASYSVTPASPHVYSHVAVTSPLTSSVSVVESRASVAASESEVLVYPKHPSGKFLVNPSNPPNNGLALLMPEEPLPGQSRIDKYVWTFLDDYNKVTDNASTQPIYRDLLGKLIASPGDLGLQGEAIALGILPTDALGALNSDQIKQIANVWESYFPHHIVPHYFDVGTGRVGIQLEVSYKKSSKSHVSTTQQKVTIGTPGCLPWGGAASKWFGGFTTCDTINGIESVIGPKRTPDYVALGLSAGSALRGIGLSAGMSLVVTKGILNPLTPDPNSVYLELTFDGSVGISTPIISGSFAQGWVGPPALGQPAPDFSLVDSFVTGKTLSAGFNLIVGFAAVYSPKGKANYNAGFEETLKTGVGGSFVEACSIPLSFGRDSVNELESAFMSLSTGSLVPSLGSANALLGAVLKNPGAIARAVALDLNTCSGH